MGCFIAFSRLIFHISYNLYLIYTSHWQLKRIDFMYCSDKLHRDAQEPVHPQRSDGSV